MKDETLADVLARHPRLERFFNRWPRTSLLLTFVGMLAALAIGAFVVFIVEMYTGLPLGKMFNVAFIAGWSWVLVKAIFGDLKDQRGAK